MNDELRERLNEFRASSAFASSEDVQWLVDRVEEAEARADRAQARAAEADIAASTAHLEVADCDAKLAAVQAEADALRAWCESAVRERKKLDGYSYRGTPCDRSTCSLRNDPSNMQADCRFCENEDGHPQPLYLCEGPIPPRVALSLPVPSTQTKPVSKCSGCGKEGHTIAGCGPSAQGALGR